MSFFCKIIAWKTVIFLDGNTKLKITISQLFMRLDQKFEMQIFVSLTYLNIYAAIFNLLAANIFPKKTEIKILICNVDAQVSFLQLAEGPGTARVNMQPAEHLYLSGFRVSGPQVQGSEGEGQTCIKTFLGQVGMNVQNFVKVDAGVWIFISPPHTNRQTNKQTSVRPFLYI